MGKKEFYIWILILFFFNFKKQEKFNFKKNLYKTKAGRLVETRPGKTPKKHAYQASECSTQMVELPTEVFWRNPFPSTKYLLISPNNLLKPCPFLVK